MTCVAFQNLNFGICEVWLVISTLPDSSRFSNNKRKSQPQWFKHVGSHWSHLTSLPGTRCYSWFSSLTSAGPAPGRLSRVLLAFSTGSALRGPSMTAVRLRHHLCPRHGRGGRGSTEDKPLFVRKAKAFPTAHPANWCSTGMRVRPARQQSLPRLVIGLLRE